MRFHRIIASALPLLASVASTLAWISQLDDSDQLVSRYADHSDALSSRFADYDDELSARDNGFGIDSGYYDLRSLTDYELRSLTDYLDDYLEARERSSYSAKQAKSKLTKEEQASRKDAVRSQVQANKANKVNKAASGNRRRIPRPNMRKGDPKGAKSFARQTAANKAQKDRKAAGRDRFADVRKKYKTGNTEDAAHALTPRSQAQPKPGGTVGQTASTAGGVAIGSSIGHTKGGTKK
ncbi:hypothetical protein FA13DRAFT_1743088 [Coprinellus micaceus]|uniref:Uncharacterized protein n=1 Tax=Coprinellus micaceus TaxID=71717 RepID=A0A4Y7SFG4_COPMI|nr:hypothetical protein FA13DRAFT_1743088 [Coprinellus micaceus]